MEIILIVISKMNNPCKYSLIILLIIITLILTSSLFWIYSDIMLRTIRKLCYNTEQFSSSKQTPSYTEYNNELELMNITDDIGAPPGILKSSKNIGCDTKKNILIQKNVTFKPSLVDNGEECTSVEKVWV
jgi:hypothetical protein